MAKKDKINELNNYIGNKSYSKRNKELINSIISSSIEKINKADEVETIDDILSDALNKIDKIKTKACGSNTIVIYANLLSLIVVAYVLLKKSK